MSRQYRRERATLAGSALHAPDRQTGAILNWPTLCLRGSSTRQSVQTLKLRERPMYASSSDVLMQRRQRQDRRTRGRLRDLCDEVLASYRMAQGQDLVSAEERESAQQVLRQLTPGIAG